MIRKFSPRACHYILAYFYVENNCEQYMEGELIELNIEQIIKEFKRHQNAIDFDEKFINYCFKSDKSATKEQALKLKQRGAQ